jgi:hypothetical protein
VSPSAGRPAFIIIQYYFQYKFENDPEIIKKFTERLPKVEFYE